MTETIAIGKLAGVPLRIHWSVLVILCLFTWSLASMLPATAPGHSVLTYWLAGLAGAVALLASLVAHELMHAVTARRAGVEVADITLWLFGGVAQLNNEAPTARADLRIAASGPALSLGLAAVFAVVAGLLDVLGVTRIVVSVSWWLSSINLVLGLFNLLPGAPLDGGRILRACLWQRHGDRMRATVSAARGGRVLAYSLIALGLLQFLAGWMPGGVWTVFIGWFVLVAARTEEDQVQTRQALTGIYVRDVMTPHPRTVPGWITVDDFVQGYLLGDRHSAYPVVDRNGSVTGLITLTQLRSIPASQRARTLLYDAAIPIDQVPSAAPHEPISDLLDRLTPNIDGRALAFAGMRLAGIVTARDIARLLAVRQLARHG